jgi:hypothetical protein
MARKLGQIIARGQDTWLVRIYQGRDPEIGMRKYLTRCARASLVLVAKPSRFLVVVSVTIGVPARNEARPLGFSS